MHEPSDPAADFFAADIDLSIAGYSPGDFIEDELRAAIAAASRP